MELTFLVTSHKRPALLFLSISATNIVIIIASKYKKKLWILIFIKDHLHPSFPFIKNLTYECRKQRFFFITAIHSTTSGKKITIIIIFKAVRQSSHSQRESSEKEQVRCGWADINLWCYCYSIPLLYAEWQFVQYEADSHS